MLWAELVVEVVSVVPAAVEVLLVVEGVLVGAAILLVGVLMEELPCTTTIVTGIHGFVGSKA